MTGSKRVQAELVKLAEHHEAIANAVRTTVAALATNGANSAVELRASSNGHGTVEPTIHTPERSTPKPKRRKMSRKARAAISAAQKARWATWHSKTKKGREKEA
jgi:hypothetical protein